MIFCAGDQDLRLPDRPLVRVRGTLAQRVEHLDGDRQHQGLSCLGGDLGERLQRAQRQGARLASDHARGLRDALGGLIFALGCDHLGVALALGLRLARHRALH
jgi:hypothetical protein